jgi:hypothetical protein
VNLKRTLVSVGVNLFLQLTGNIFVTIYGAVFMSGLNGVNAFTMTTINTAVNAVFTLFSQLLTDRVGRRYVCHINPNPFLPFSLTTRTHTPTMFKKKKKKRKEKRKEKRKGDTGRERKVSFFSVK